jgi:hypothetical protein
MVDEVEKKIQEKNAAALDAATKHVEQMKELYQGFKDSITSGWEEVMYDWIKGTEDMASAFQKMAQQALNYFTQLVAKMAANKLFDVVFNGDGSQKGTDKGFKISPFLNFIPVVGPALSAIAGSMGFASGTPYVPQDMPANIHQGEMIIPKTFSEGIRSGTMSIGNNKETNSLLGAVLNKLDYIGEMAQEKGRLYIGDEQLVAISRALRVSNYKLGEYSV